LCSKNKTFLSKLCFYFTKLSYFFHHKKMKSIFLLPLMVGLQTWEYEAKIVVGNNQVLAVMIVFVTLRTRLSEWPSTFTKLRKKGKTLKMLPSRKYLHSLTHTLSLSLSLSNTRRDFHPGVDFTNIFTQSYYMHSSQKRKNSVKSWVSFYAFGIYVRKSSYKMLMKLTPAELIV